MSRKIARDVRDSLSGNPTYIFNDIGKDPWLDPVGRVRFLGRIGVSFAPLDHNGIPVVIDSRSGARGYRPGRVASYALACWNKYRQTGDELYGDVFLNCADWFMKFENGQFPSNSQSGSSNTRSLSGLSQGMGISVLVRAGLLTQDDRFVVQSRKALQPMLISIEKGGVATRLDDGSFFIEEYPQNPRPVLNGYLAAVFGILDLHRIDPCPRTKTVVDDCWATLNSNIKSWNLDGWSAYDLHNYRGGGSRNFSTSSYHSLHIVQLEYAFAQTKAPLIQEVSVLWQDSFERTTTRMQSLLGKMRYRIRERLCNNAG
jgi:hypothetical protein